jgi:hypothetical protein
MRISLTRLALLVMVAVSMSMTAAARAAAQGLSDDGGAEWRVEQPEPPAPPPGVEGSKTPIGLGRIGDIQFWAPNRGVLITAGNGSTIPPGVWFYNGERWRELSDKCGATEGRIAWAGENEFWTVSDGRPGEASLPNQTAPLEDNTLCHFAPGLSGNLEIVASYASPAFQAGSYQAMHAAGCIEPLDCWFAGGALPPPQIGAFQLHWNGHKMEAEPYVPESHEIWSMQEFEGRLYDGVRRLGSDSVEKVVPHPPAMHVINGAGSAETQEPVSGPPPFGPEAPQENPSPYAVEYMHLGVDADALWAASGPSATEAKGAPAGVGVAVVRYARSNGEESPTWSEVLGSKTTPTGSIQFPQDEVNAIAAEPETSSAWMALDPISDAEVEILDHRTNSIRAKVARISVEGSGVTVSDEEELPAEDPNGRGYGPLGPATQLVCPAEHDCWLATTQGWLMHLSSEEERTHPEPDTDPVFSSQAPITFRPPDEGLPQVVPDAPPPDDSGLEQEEATVKNAFVVIEKPETFATVPVQLLSNVHSRLVHGTILELSFHLAVRARLRLMAERHHKVVASTATHTLDAGKHSLKLRLNVRQWPTKLNLQTHALAPLPTRSTREVGVNSVSTSLAFPNTLPRLRSRLSF